MSRIGKKIIIVPEKTEISFLNGLFSVKGPLGSSIRQFKSDIDIKIDGGKITLSPVKSDLETAALWGTYASHVSNMIDGVHKLFEKKLIVEGIGFKSEVKGGTLVLSLGFSHPVIVKIPAELKVKAEKNIITVSGVNKESVGEFVAKVRALKKPEPYKGKGIRYDDEVIRMKQ